MLRLQDGPFEGHRDSEAPLRAAKAQTLTATWVSGSKGFRVQGSGFRVSALTLGQFRV